MKRFVFFLFVLIIFQFSGCSSDPEGISTDLEYFPLQKGVFQIYDVHEVRYTVANDPLELDYELKTVVVDSFQNTANRYTYVLYRYTRTDDMQAWDYLDTWSVRPEPNRVIVGEQTTDFVKLLIPVQGGSRWDGNAFNSREEELYEVKYRSQPCTVGPEVFQDCTEIIHSDLDDVIVKTDLRNEIYSRSVGLVYREETILNFCTAGCSGLGEVESGIEYTQTIKSYGIE